MNPESLPRSGGVRPSQLVAGQESGNAGKKAGAEDSAKNGPQLQQNKTIDSSTIPKSQRGLAVLREFFNPGAKNTEELYDSMRKALAGDKALILHVNSNGGHSAIIAIHLDEKGNLVNTLYDPAGTYTGIRHNKGSGDDLTNDLPAGAPHDINWSLADYIEHHATDGSMSFVPIWTDGNTARHLEYPPNTMIGFCADSSGKVIQQIPGVAEPSTAGSYFPNSLSDQLFRLTGKKVTIQHKQ